MNRGFEGQIKKQKFNTYIRATSIKMAKEKLKSPCELGNSKLHQIGKCPLHRNDSTFNIMLGTENVQVKETLQKLFYIQQSFNISYITYITVIQTLLGSSQ